MSDSSYRRTVIYLAMGVLLAGCQSDADVSPATTPSRTIEHAMGSVEVPVSPQRVVVLDTAPLDAALALGVKPVGTIVYRQSPDYLGDRTEGIEIIGDGNKPNLEAVLNLQPDLILGSKIGAGELYTQLSQIAPTVLTEGSGRTGDWSENLQLYAEALGKSTAAEQLLADYRQRVRQLQAAIDQPQALEISVVIVPQDIVRAFTTGSFAGSVLQDIGFSRPPAQDDPDGYVARLSPESLEALDGDYVFLIYSTYQPGGTSKEAFVTHPIWSQLQVVQQDRVCQVDGAVWIAGRSILAARQILTDIETCLAADLESTETAE
ncbi:MAG: iron-siderophore ABC transporter substrate-binding protein [Cyanobacteria bacterium P01_E01_bin.48]